MASRHNKNPAHEKHAPKVLIIDAGDLEAVGGQREYTTDGFTVAELASALGITHKRAKDRVQHSIQCGRLERIGYRLALDCTGREITVPVFKAKKTTNGTEK